MHRHAVALLAALCLLSSRAFAAPLRADPVRLVYTLGKGAASCPDVETLRGSVVKEMGYDPFLPDAGPLLAVTIERRAGEFWVAMSLRNEAGEIEWNVTTMHTNAPCRELVDALGMSVAIRLEPDPAAASPACPVCPALPAPPVPPVAPAPRCPPVEEVPPAKPAEVAADAAPYRPRIFVGAGPLLAFQTPFAVSPGGTLFVGLRWPRVSLAVEGKGLLPYVAGIDTLRLNTSSLTGGPVLCGHLGILFGCGAIDAGGLGLSAKTYTPSHQPSKPYLLVNAGLQVGVQVPVTRYFAFRADAEVVGAIADEPARVETQQGQLRSLERNLVLTGVAWVVTF